MNSIINLGFVIQWIIKHVGGTVEAQTEQGNEGLVTVFSSDSASSGDAVRESRGAEHWHFSLQLQTFDSFCVSELPAPAASCPPEREPADLPALQQADCKITCCLSACSDSSNVLLQLGLHISLFTFCSSLKDLNIHSLILLECPTAQQVPLRELSLHRLTNNTFWGRYTQF